MFSSDCAAEAAIKIAAATIAITGRVFMVALSSFTELGPMIVWTPWCWSRPLSQANVGQALSLIYSRPFAAVVLCPTNQSVQHYFPPRLIQNTIQESIWDP